VRLKKINNGIGLASLSLNYLDQVECANGESHFHAVFVGDFDDGTIVAHADDAVLSPVFFAGNVANG
jgi:hypothetical protein